MTRSASPPTAARHGAPLRRGPASPFRGASPKGPGLPTSGADNSKTHPRPIPPTGRRGRRLRAGARILSALAIAEKASGASRSVSRYAVSVASETRRLRVSDLRQRAADPVRVDPEDLRDPCGASLRQRNRQARVEVVDADLASGKGDGRGPRTACAGKPPTGTSNRRRNVSRQIRVNSVPREPPRKRARPRADPRARLPDRRAAPAASPTGARDRAASRFPPAPAGSRAGNGNPTSQITRRPGSSTSSAAWSKSETTRPRIRREVNPRPSRTAWNAATRAKHVPPLPDSRCSRQKISGSRGFSAGSATAACALDLRDRLERHAGVEAREQGFEKADPGLRPREVQRLENVFERESLAASRRPGRHDFFVSFATSAPMRACASAENQKSAKGSPPRA